MGSLEGGWRRVHDLDGRPPHSGRRSRPEPALSDDAGFRDAPSGTADCNRRHGGYCRAMAGRSPILSEFETPEQADAYEAWLRAKVDAALADERTSVAHDGAVVRARAIIEGRRTRDC